jgi:hypothetical protein
MNDAATPAGLNVEAFRAYSELGKERRELEGKAKALKEKMAAMEDDLLEQLMQVGVPEVRLDSGALVSTRTTITVKAGHGEKATEEDWNLACDTFEEIGMDEFSTRRFNLQTIKGWIGGIKKEADAEGREYEEVAELLPPEVQRVLSVGTVTALTTKGG